MANSKPPKVIKRNEFGLLDEATLIKIAHRLEEDGK